GGFFLAAEGPASLQIEGDAIKTRRIAQNLLLNALKYTEQGGVRVSWAETKVGDLERWVLNVQDTGPGFANGSVPPITQVLKEATDEAKLVEKEQESPDAGGGVASAAPLQSQSAHRPNDEATGEGLGLSIANRPS